MRNLFLSLVLANLFLLAWQLWVDPGATAPPARDSGELVLFKKVNPPPAPGRAGEPAVRESIPGRAADGLPAGTCVRVGPLASATAAQQVGQQLAGRGIEALPVARDTQRWLGHWVQIGGFGSVAEAESARQRLVAGGIADAYLMQDSTQPLVSLGVFRDRSGAELVAAEARRLGFQADMTDRYRPTVEHWLLIQPRPGQPLVPSDLGLADDLIMRAEQVPCTEARPAPDLAESAAPAVPDPGGRP